MLQRCLGRLLLHVEGKLKRKGTTLFTCPPRPREQEERSEKAAMEGFQAALTEAVEAKEDRKTSLNLIRTIPFCSNRQLRLLTTARSSLARMLGSSTVRLAPRGAARLSMQWRDSMQSRGWLRQPARLLHASCK